MHEQSLLHIEISAVNNSSSYKNTAVLLCDNMNTLIDCYVTLHITNLKECLKLLSLA